MEQVWDSVNRTRPAKWRKTENETYELISF